MAAQRRRRQKQEEESNDLGLSEDNGSQSLAATDNIMQLRQALKAKSSQLYKLFSIWDEDGDGSIDEREFGRAMRMLGLQPAKEDFAAFCKLFTNGEVRLDELTTLIESTPVNVETLLGWE